MFTIYSANVTGNAGNCSYPNRHAVTDEESLKAAVCHDYVCAEYRYNYRNGENFLTTDCLAVDCDNDHSEDPADWKTPEDIKAAFPGVSFAVHFSRFNGKVKNGKPPRPKFHVLFPIVPMTDAEGYAAMKREVNEVFPYFDTNALDAARFFFGTGEPEVAMYPGEKTLTEFMESLPFSPAGGNTSSTVASDVPPSRQQGQTAGTVLAVLAKTEEPSLCLPLQGIRPKRVSLSMVSG